MSNPAHLPPPPDGDVTRAPTFLAVSIIFNATAIVSTVVRLSARLSTKKAGWDDFFIALAVLLLIVQIVVTAISINAGFGRHEYFLNVEQISRALEFNYISEVLLFLVIPFTKISICLFVLRIRDKGWLKWLLYGLMLGLVITTVVPFVVLLAQCRPISAFWHKGTGECWSPQVLNDVNYLQVAYSIFSDVVCCALPVIILWNVQMRPRFKLAICGLMSLGLVATVCAIIRMTLFVGDLSPDLTWSRCVIAIWCSLEQATAIIAANLALSGFVYQFCVDRGWSKKYSTPTSQRYFGSAPYGPHQSGMSTDRSGPAPYRPHLAAVPTRNIQKVTEFSIGSSEGRDSDVPIEDEVKRQEWV